MTLPPGPTTSIAREPCIALEIQKLEIYENIKRILLQHTMQTLCIICSKLEPLITSVSVLFFQKMKKNIRLREIQKEKKKKKVPQAWR